MMAQLVVGKTVKSGLINFKAKVVDSTFSKE